MAENRVLSQFPAVNEPLHEPHQKRDQQKAKRSRRKQQQNLFCLPNPVKAKAGNMQYVGRLEPYAAAVHRVRLIL